MNDEREGVVATTVKSQEQGIQLMEKLVAVAQPGMVFGEPTTSGEYTVVTASEVTVAMGFGFGMGGGSRPLTAQDEKASEGQTESQQGFGGGGGGGGVSTGRPVAVISVGTDGVQIKPVVDLTKIAVVTLATLGSMLLILGRMRGASRR